MVGQHIYSRCLEGYFSKSRLNADSTTVTISANMFAREEQARKIAKECEKISTLEDVRAVPSAIQDAYRGVLKIRRLNRQLTVVCRSYRLHSDQSQTGGGESRDFTYGSSFILSGEDKQRFLEHPEYCLNIQDFEPYPSVIKRIEESRKNGRHGRIEANENYSLFRSSCVDISPEVFAHAGFTKKLFTDYISSIIERVSYSHYSGHENDKVLVILPKQFNKPWEKSGGNIYAEEVLAATMKILPEGVRGQLNATTGGMDDPGAFVLEGYQLVFMESGSAKIWKKSEYSVIDLENQESQVTEGLNTDYGEFLWDYLNQEEVRKKFEKQYEILFGEEQTAEGDNSPEKFSLTLRLLQEESRGLTDSRNRGRLFAELADSCGDFWTEQAVSLAVKVLNEEIRNPGYSRILEGSLLNLIRRETCPEELKAPVIVCLLQKIFQGDADEQTVSWMSSGVQAREPLIIEKVTEANRRIASDRETTWYRHDSLLEFYFYICKNPDIAADTAVKQQVLSILAEWYISFLDKNDLENCVRIAQILSEQLDDPSLKMESRKEIYQDLIYLLFFSDAEGRKQMGDILKKEERKFSSAPENLRLFWECFKGQIRQDDITVNGEVIWQMTYLAVSRDQVFLRDEWEPVYRDMVKRFGGRYRHEIFDITRQYFLGWAQSIQDEQKRRLVYIAVAISESDNIEYGRPYYMPDLEQLRDTMRLLEENGLFRPAAMLLYKRYRAEQGAKEEFIQELNDREVWKLLLSWQLCSEKDTYLKSIILKLYDIRKELLPVIAGFTWEDKKETMKAAKIYFYLLRAYTKNNHGDLTSLPVWCRLYRNEISDIAAASQESPFADYVKECFRIVMAECRHDSVRELDMKDVVFMTEAGLLPLGDGWECLEVLSTIYTLEPQCVSEEFLYLRERIIKESDKEIKQIYLEALEMQRTHLRNTGVESELIYNVALLEEQLRQELQNDAEFDLKNVVSKIFNTSGDKEELVTEFSLLYVIRSYGADSGRRIYDCGEIRKRLFLDVASSARSKPDLFADKAVLKAYKLLGREDRGVLKQAGFEQYLQKLPREWKKGYGVYEEENSSGVILSVILAGVFLLAGVGVEVLCGLFYENIGAQLMMILGVVFSAIGAAGILIVLICMMISGRRESSDR